MPGKTQTIETGRDVTLQFDADRATIRAGGGALDGHVTVTAGGRVVGALWADPAPTTPARLFGGGSLELSDPTGQARVTLRGGTGLIEGRVLRAEDADGNTGVRVDGPDASITIGGERSAELTMIDSRGLPFLQSNNLWLKLGTPLAQKGDVATGNGCTIMMHDNTGTETINISSFNMRLQLGEPRIHYKRGIELDGRLSKVKLGVPPDGSLANDDKRPIELDGETATITLGRAGAPGTLRALDNAGHAAVSIDGRNAVLTIGARGREGGLVVVDGGAREICRIDASKAEMRLGAHDAPASLRFQDGVGREVLRFADATLRVGIDGNAGALLVRDAAGRAVVDIDGDGARIDVGASGHSGEIAVRDGSGRETIRLDGDSGDILLTNADCAEEFDFIDADIAPGMVVVIDEDERLAPCAVAYDRRVAGVVSGAGRFRPAIVLDRRPGAPRPAVAMIGKVECNVDAGHGPIRCGDLLVSSSTPGHAMAATDPARTAGAVLGKALRGLDAGTGRVPILVCLQ